MASSVTHGSNGNNKPRGETVPDTGNVDDALNDETAPQICWLFSKQQLQNTPSIQAGLTPLTERRYRRQACDLIMKAANQLQLGQQTMSSGILFFHRFFMFHSLTAFNRYLVATTSLFLAGKVEETPKKCRDMIRVVRDILQEMQEGDIFGADPRDDIVMMEKIVLQTLKFDFDVEHPHKFLAQYYKIFKVADKQRLEKLMQMAWAFTNDASLLTLPLEWEPEIIAVAMLHLSANLQKFNTGEFEGKSSRYQKWWDSFVENLTTEVIDSVCHAVLDMYEERKLDQVVDQADDRNTVVENGGNFSQGYNARHLHASSSPPSHAAPSPSRIQMPTPKKARIGERPRSPPRVGGSAGRQPPPPPPPSSSNKPPPPPPSNSTAAVSSSTVLESSNSFADAKHAPNSYAAGLSAEAALLSQPFFAANSTGFYPYAAPNQRLPFPAAAIGPPMPQPQFSLLGASSSNNTNTFGIPVGGNAATIYNNVPPVSSANAAQRHGILLGQSLAPGYSVMQPQYQQQQQPPHHSALQRR